MATTYKLSYTADEIDKRLGLQSDFGENDKNSPAYIKNRTHYYGDIYVEDLLLPTPSSLYITTDDTTYDEINIGYALLGQKLNLVAGNTYTYEIMESVNDEEQVLSTQTLTAYTVTSLFSSLSDEWADVIVLLNGNTPIIVSGATATDFTDTSTFVKADDTMYIGYMPTIEDISMVHTLQGYNNNVMGYKTLDMNYLPMEQLNGRYKLKDSSVTTEKLADSSVTTEKLADGSVKGSKFEQAKYLYRNSTLTDDVSYISLSAGTQKYSKLLLTSKFQAASPADVKFVKVQMSGLLATQQFIPITVSDYESTNLEAYYSCITIITEAIGYELRVSVDYFQDVNNYSKINVMHVEYILPAVDNDVSSISFSLYNDSCISSKDIEILSGAETSLIGIVSK